MSWMDRETARWLRGNHPPVSTEKQWWEVTTNGEFIGVRATLGTSDEIRQLVSALNAYLPYMGAREGKSQSGNAVMDEACRDRIVESVAKAIAHSFAVGSPDIAAELRMDWQTWIPEALAALAAAEEAQGTEAQRAETSLGSVHDGPVRVANAPKLTPGGSHG